MGFLPTIYTRLVALLVTFVAIIAIGIGAIYFEGTEQLLVENAISELEGEALLFEADLDAVISQLESDVQLLRNMPPASGIVRSRENGGIDPLDSSTEEQWMNRYEHIFEETIRGRPYYTQLRLIGVADRGKELLRVERSGESVVVIPEELLTPKEDRPYFYPTLGLPEGEVYISQIDLNREGLNADIQIPYTLVIRAAMPILDEMGEPVAMVMINANFSRMLEDVANQVASERVLYVATQTGSYLLNPDNSKLYADDLGHDQRIQQDFPALSEMGRSARNHITVVADNQDGGEILGYHTYYYDGPESSNYIYYIFSANYQDFVSGLADVQIKGAFASLGFLIVSGLIVVLILYLLLNPYRQISTGLARYQAGEKNLLLPTWARTEAGSLARKFESMIEIKEQDDWIRDNLVDSARALLAFDDFKLFCDGFMQLICPLVEAQIGVIYLKNQVLSGVESDDPKAYTPLGSFGLQQSVETLETFRSGEGLIGQCVRDQKIRLLPDVPEEYFRVSTVFTSSKPQSIFLLPVIYETRTVAVIELASVSGFSSKSQTFMERLCFDLGVIINNLASSQRIQALLDTANKTASELKVSNQLDEFAHIASHDLKEPLRGLSNYSRFLLEDYQETLDEEGKEMLGRMGFLSQRMEDLINELLYYSRLSNQQLAIQETNIPALVEGIREMLQDTLNEQNVTLIVQEDIPEVVCDQPRVTEVFRNLITNAIKYNHKTEKIIEVGYLDSVKQTDQLLHNVFFVRDNGMGIKKEYFEDLFKMFRRLNEEDEETKGSGVGLAFVKKIVERHGGHIWLESSLGDGTTFYFTLKPEEQ